MSYLRTELIQNGDMYQDFYIYRCDNCMEEVPENFPHFNNKNTHYCIDCAFKLNKISEEVYIKTLPICLSNLHADVIDGEIIVWTGNIHPLDKRRDKLDRRCSQYRNWRKEVLKRDRYKCTICNSSKDLEAHHIKEFSKYRNLRFKVSNGLTLCKRCHKLMHKKKVTK